MFPLIILRTVYNRPFIFHMLIGPGEDLISIDFVFFKLMVKGTVLQIILENHNIVQIC